MLQGRDGWLFVKDELARACTPLVPTQLALERWRELVSIVRAAGKRAVVVVPPDKGSIYGEHLPGGDLTDCARGAERRFWATLARAPAAWGVAQLEGPLARRKRRTMIPLYSKADSHWTTFGGLELVRSVLDRVGGRVRLEPQEVVSLGVGHAVGDLTVLLGESTREPLPEHTIRRAPGAPRVLGRALLFHDSFGERHLDDLPWSVAEGRQLADAIAGADVVIFEIVERDFALRGSDGGQVSRSFLRVLRKRLGSG